MHRRLVLASIAVALGLPACGGGGGGGSVTPGGAASAGSLASTPVVAWGDSHTSGLPDDRRVLGYAEALAALLPARAVLDRGVAGQTSSQIADRQAADAGARDDVAIFWYGGNNQWDPDRIRADVARSVAALAPGNQRFLVLPVLNQAGPAERRGGSVYEGIVRLNAQLAADYPQNFVDVRSALVQAADPANAQDRQDLRDDVPPTSLRADGVHLNAAGYALVARVVRDALATRGW